MAMNPTAKFTPELPFQIIGNQRAIERLERCITTSRPALIYGEPGIGKTTSVHALAHKLGLQIFEVNASDEKRSEDMEHILEVAVSKGLVDYLIFFDEVDVGGKISTRQLELILHKTRHPLVFAANEIFKVPDIIKRECEVIRYYKPSTHEILSHVKTHIKDPHINYDQITGDVRNALTIAEYGGESYHTEDDFTAVEKLFQGQATLDSPDKMYWLLDNAHNKFNGLQLVKFIDLLTVIDSTHHYQALSCMKANARGKVEFPYFIQKYSTFKQKKEEDQR